MVVQRGRYLTSVVRSISNSNGNGNGNGHRGAIFDDMLDTQICAGIIISNPTSIRRRRGLWHFHLTWVGSQGTVHKRGPWAVRRYYPSMLLTGILFHRE